MNEETLTRLFEKIAQEFVKREVILEKQHLPEINSITAPFIVTTTLLRMVTQLKDHEHFMRLKELCDKL